MNAAFRLERQQALERLKREVRAASALNHAGIATVYDIDHDEEQWFIAMELLEGLTLRDTSSDEMFSLELEDR